jgi:hypothetical protein
MTPEEIQKVTLRNADDVNKLCRRVRNAALEEAAAMVKDQAEKLSLFSKSDALCIRVDECRYLTDKIRSLKTKEWK